MQRIYVFILKVKKAIFREYRYSPAFRQFFWSAFAAALALVRLVLQHFR